MSIFCQVNNLSHIIEELTYFKSPENLTPINLILTKKPKKFVQFCTFEKGRSDFHKMTLTLLKPFCKNQAPIIISNRSYKDINNSVFRGHVKIILEKSNISEFSLEGHFISVKSVYANQEKICWS